MTFDPFAVAASISDCICPRLKNAERGEDAWAGDCCVIVGPGSWDKCCEGEGTMWVSIGNGFPTTSFPTPQGLPSPTPCGAPNQAVMFEVGVIRCVCAMAEDGDACTCEEKETGAVQVMGDLAAVLEGLSCCFTDLRADGCDNWILNGWRTVRDGGCAGVVVTLTVEMDNPCCPNEEN